MAHRNRGSFPSEKHLHLGIFHGYVSHNQMVYPTVYEYIPFNSYLAHCSMAMLVITIWYPLVNKQLDPENHQFFMKTSLPTQMTARVYVSHNQRVTIILSLEDDVLHPRGVVSLDLYIQPRERPAQVRCPPVLSEKWCHQTGYTTNTKGHMMI